MKRSLLIGFTLSFNGSGNAIPRKPRVSVGSNSHVAKHLGPSGLVDEINQMKSYFKDSGVDIPSIPHMLRRKGNRWTLIKKTQLIGLPIWTLIASIIGALVLIMLAKYGDQGMSTKRR